MAKSADDLLRERLGVSVFPRVNPETSSVGTSRVLIARQNPNRISLFIVNLSANIVTVGPNENISAGNGFIVPPGGGSIEINQGEDYSLQTLAWYGISTAPANSIFVVEQIIK